MLADGAPLVAAALPSTASVSVSGDMADLYMERLREYNNLAALYDANYKDTVEEAEKVGGVIEVSSFAVYDMETAPYLEC